MSPILLKFVKEALSRRGLSLSSIEGKRVFAFEWCGDSDDEESTEDIRIDYVFKLKPNGALVLLRKD